MNRLTEEFKTQYPVHVALLTAQALAGVYDVVSHAALVGGTNRLVFSFYRDLLAAVILVPAAFLIERGNRITLSCNLTVRLTLLGLFGVYGTNYLHFVGMEYTSAGFSSDVQPMGPTLVAVIAIIFGFEEILWHRRDGKARIFGIALCCAGGAVMNLYKGRAVIPWSNHVGDVTPWTPISESFPKMTMSSRSLMSIHDLGITGWQFGAICLVGSTLCLAMYINLLADFLKTFPAPVTATAYAYGVGAMFMGLTGAYTVRDPSAWAIPQSRNLVALLYSGIIGSALNFSLLSWSIGRVGPLFVAGYLPVQPVVATTLALGILGSTIYLGSVLGTVMVVLGIVLMSWAYEEKKRLAYLSLIFQRPLYDPVQELLIEPREQV